LPSFFDQATDVEVSRNLAFFLARVPIAQSQNVILRLVHSGDTWVRFFAVTALANYPLAVLSLEK